MAVPVVKVEIGFQSNASLGSNYASLVASYDPTAWWKLDDSSGSMLADDSSANGYTGAVYGSVTFGEDGPVTIVPAETAAGFDGSTGYVNVNALPILVANGAISLIAWFKTTDTGFICGSSETFSTPGLGFDISFPFTFGQTTGAGIGLSVVYGGSVRAWLNGTAVDIGTGYDDGDWHFVVASYEGFGSSSRDVYVDGVLIDTDTSGEAADYDGSFQIGANAIWGAYFDGDIAQVSILPSALTADQVSDLYDAASTVFVDVSQWCTGQITTNRGRSRETDQYSAGTLVFTLRNEDRRFDPSNTASPYYPGIVPRALVNAYIDDVQVFGGYIDDLDVAYVQPNICTVDVSCLDSFTVAANTYLTSYTASQELTGARIIAVLDSVDFPSSRSIATGRATLQSNIFTSTPASPLAVLDHLQTVARSENGYLFVDRTGDITFYDRYQGQDATTDIVFSDLDDGIGYQAIGQKSQALLLYNQVIGTRNSNATLSDDSPVAQAANDTASQAQYLILALSLSQLENVDDAEVLKVCEYLVGRYSQPDVRFDTLTVELQTLDTETRAALLALDLVQIVAVKRTPPGSGSPSTIEKNQIIDGIAFTLDVSAATYQMNFQFGSVDTRNFLKLDDPIFGLLDNCRLNY